MISARAAWVCFCLFATGLATHADTPVIHVDASQVVNRITPWMTGACIEDVNHEIYGGLYDQKIFGESFEEPPQSAHFDGWTTYGGQWQTEGQAGGTQVAADPGGKLVRNGVDFADGTIEADVRLAGAQGVNAGLLVRVRNPSVGADNFDGYEISLSASGQNVILGKHVHNWQPLASVPASVTPDTWHHLRITLNGPHIQVWLDNAAAPVVDFTDTNAPLPAGTFALRTWNADAAFRNVRVKTGGQAADVALTATAGVSVSGMWDALHTGTAQAEFQQTSDHPFNGQFCQEIRRGAGTGVVGVANRGLNRWGIAVRQGQIFAGRIYLRGQNLSGPVIVALQSASGQKTYAAVRLSGIGAAWRKYPFRLTSRATDPDARFAVWIDSPGTLWLDQAVLMGTGNERFHGLPVRADIANALIAEGVTFLRYGGTMVNVPGYRWKNMIGDPDRRPPYVGNWYPDSSNGFGIFDFLNFCEAAHIQAAFAINSEESAQDCADLADYLTAPPSNPWGRRRAEDGHPAPYQVHYIEIGNEECIGGDDPAAYRHYAQRFQVIAQAIHSRNPHLQLVCAAWWRPNSPNMETVFRAINSLAAAWDLHVWADDARSGDATRQELDQAKHLFHTWDPATALHAVIFEENGNRHDMQRALGHATTLEATRDNGDFVLADCDANCLQPWQQNDNGWDQGQIFFTPDHVWAMPPYYVQQMASQTYEPLRVASSINGESGLFVDATRSLDAHTLVLNVTNTGNTTTSASIMLAGFDGVRSPAAIQTLAGPWDAVNPPGGPPEVRSVASFLPVSGAAWSEIFPAHSFTTVRLVR